MILILFVKSLLPWTRIKISGIVFYILLLFLFPFLFKIHILFLVFKNLLFQKHLITNYKKGYFRVLYFYEIICLKYNYFYDVFSWKNIIICIINHFRDIQIFSVRIRSFIHLNDLYVLNGSCVNDISLGVIRLNLEFW